MDNPVLVHSITLDGKTYPPIEACCEFCSYACHSEEFSPDQFIICGSAERYVELDDTCKFFDLNRSALPDELEDYLDQHPELFEDVSYDLIGEDAKRFSTEWSI